MTSKQGTTPARSKHHTWKHTHIETRKHTRIRTPAHDACCAKQKLAKLMHGYAAETFKSGLKEQSEQAESAHRRRYMNEQELGSTDTKATNTG